MMSIRRLTAIVVMLVFTSTIAFAANQKGKDIDAEKNLGKQGAEQVAKTMKFVTDPKIVKRVETIGQNLASIAKTVKVPAGYGNSDLADFTYSFKVVEDKTTNAFSLPAGYIYVNKGLIDRVESDDELAAVIAHEISHVAHHHMLKLLQKQSQIDSTVLLVIAAAALGKAGASDVGNIFYGAKLVEMAKMSTYGRTAENDADTTAIEYLVRAKYNPVGMLTVLEGLARDETYNPTANNNTVYSDHPASRDRAENIVNQLKKRGIPIDRYAVEGGTQASVKEMPVKDKKAYAVIVSDKVVFRPADMGAETSEKRANGIADTLNKLFRQSPAQWEVRLSPDGTAVYLRETLVVDVAQADADLLGQSRETLAAQAKQSIQAALLSEQMRLMY